MTKPFALVFTVLAAFVAVDAHAAALDDIGTGTMVFTSGQSAAKAQSAVALRTDIDVKVSGLIARVTVRQKFKNPSRKIVSAVYGFPLPEQAAVDGLKMHVGKRVIEGVIQRKHEARANFEQAKREGRRAAMVEQQRPNLFTTEVANIDGHAHVIVELTYQMPLSAEDGVVTARFPLAITPRYTSAREGRRAPAVKSGALIQHPVTFRADVTPGFRVASVESLHHPMTAFPTVGQNASQSYALRLDVDEIPADRDIVLRWAKTLYAKPEAALFSERFVDQDYRLLQLSPPQHQSRQTGYVPRDVVFIIDSSGSMYGDSMTFAQQALRMAVETLDSRDHFDIVDFDSSYRPLFSRPSPASAENKQEALRFISDLDADGGTEMQAPLEFALQEVAGSERFAQVVFMTDGAIDNEDTLERAIRLRLGNSRLFTVGIGRAPNTFFMRKMAEAGRGTFVYIGDTQQVRSEMEKLFVKMSAPVLTDIEIAIKGVGQIFPRILPDLYIGEPIVVAFENGDLSDKIIISGRFEGDAFVMEVDAPTTVQQGGVHQVFAHKKVEHLLNGTHHGNITDDVRTAVEDTGLHHHIITPYTSLVAIDKQKANPALDLARANGELPRGGTAARLSWMLGLLFAVLAAALLRRRNDANSIVERV